MQELIATIKEKFFSNVAPQVWEYKMLGNTLEDIVVALIVLVLLLIIFAIFRGAVISRLKKLAKKTKTDIDDTAIQVIQTLRPPFYFFVAFYLALQFLTIETLPRKVLEFILVIWVVYQVIKALQILVDYSLRKYLSREEKSPGTETAVKTLGRVFKGVLWVLGILLILQNLGVNVTSLIAGLGIGGIAVALALQNILSDLFNSFAIYMDKPFVPGDFIIVGEHMGIVEKIGIKSTRIRALQGEEIVISNNEMTSARIQNFKKMQERRIVFSFGVTYETPTEKMKEIPNIVKDIIDSIEITRLDRVHFKTFADSSLEFEVVYYVSTGEYVKYMDTQQEINLRIKEEFEKRGISMAYPTRTLYVQKIIDGK